MALSNGAVGWSAVCDCGFSDHTHLRFDFDTDIKECKLYHLNSCIQFLHFNPYFSTLLQTRADPDHAALVRAV